MESDLAALIQEIGEPVTVSFEPRNEGMEWSVSLARIPLIHEHFRTLDQGFRWLAQNKINFPKWEHVVREEE